MASKAVFIDFTASRKVQAVPPSPALSTKILAACAMVSIKQDFLTGVNRDIFFSGDYSYSPERF
jgi:hypothetical protein